MDVIMCVCLSKSDRGGKYLYVHSAIQREGDIATVTTRHLFPASIGLCHLRFWFHMLGSEKMGTLKVRPTPPPRLSSEIPLPIILNHVEASFVGYVFLTKNKIVL